jgi:hypothetical protein
MTTNTRNLALAGLLAVVGVGVFDSSAQAIGKRKRQGNNCCPQAAAMPAAGGCCGGYAGTGAPAGYPNAMPQVMPGRVGANGTIIIPPEAITTETTTVPANGAGYYGHYTVPGSGVYYPVPGTNGYYGAPGYNTNYGTPYGSGSNTGSGLGNSNNLGMPGYVVPYTNSGRGLFRRGLFR